ncbi:MAG: IS630 family transposase [Euryarchaeota archaeon]|nr:IS630 family transposase [Euryarchaeota archaeon]
MVISVRPITNEEGNKLRRIVRHGREPVEVRRAQVILASAQGFTPPNISPIVGMSEGYIRELIHSFNESGMAMLKPSWKPGGNYKFSDKQKERLVALATSRPQDLGLPFSQWSLSRLREAAMKQGIVDSICIEWLRVILDEAAVSHQSIKTWKDSKDPQFEEKRKRIEELTRQQSNPPVVLSMDEIGPVSLTPHGGKGWFSEKQSDRIPSLYKRLGGTRYEYMCLNVFHKQLSFRQHKYKGGKPWLDFLKQERSKHPIDQDVYIIQDGLSAHWTPEIKAWAAVSRTILVPTATQASWMNPIECYAGDIQRMALDGTNFHDWIEVKQAFQRAITYRNRERRACDNPIWGSLRTDGRSKFRRPVWKRH